MNRLSRTWNAFWAATLLAVIHLSATPAGDPGCRLSTPYGAVWEARAKSAMRKAAGKGGTPRPADDPKATISIAWDAAVNRPLLTIGAKTNVIAQVDLATNAAFLTHQPFLTLRLGASALTWTDDASPPDPDRFFRLTLRQDDPNEEAIDNFLLLDADGVAQQLFYHTDAQAVVIVAAGDSLAGLGPTWNSVKDVVTAPPGTNVAVWITLSDKQASRAKVRDFAASLGVTVPVLLDPDGLATEALLMSRAGEAVVVIPPLFTVGWRGMADGPGKFLAKAVSNVVVGVTPAYLRTPLTGTPLSTQQGAIPDYATDVAPLFYQYCATGHRPDDVAPFAMTNYDTVAGWATLIKAAMLANLMPPWHVDPQYGHWSNSLAIPSAAKATLLRWIDAGAPRGAGPDPLAMQPPPPSYRSWPAELGPPDAIVTPGVQSIIATGLEPYRYLFVQTPNTTNVWLKAAIILPSAPSVVHHYLVWKGRVGSQGLPGVSTYQSSLAGYVPGMAPYIYPSNSGVPLTASNWLTFNLHYTPVGEATNDTPQLALWYWKTPPAKTFRTESAQNFLIVIPPYDGDAQFEASIVAPATATIHRLNPHMHLRGKRMKFEAFYPNGTSETLLSVPDYNFLWQNG
jgi:hypothetical protein